jgi:tRNA pseudouridine synthase 10
VGQNHPPHDQEVLSRARRLFEKYPLCDNCLGRLIGGVGAWGNSSERGAEIKSQLLREAKRMLEEHRIEEAYQILKNLSSTGHREAIQLAERIGARPEIRIPCVVCLGRFNETVIEELAQKAVQKSLGYEFYSFLVGAHVPSHIASIEERIFSEIALTESRTLRKDISSELGRRLEELTGKTVSFTSPDIIFKVDIFMGEVEVNASPLYIRGQYFKHQANVPQTPWFCSKCWGAGCKLCGFTGRIYPDSVAEYIAGPAVKLAGAIGYKFHAAGREDVDVQVGGEGRPFILELIQPSRRRIDLSLLKQQITEYSKGNVSVENLSFADSKDLKLLKSEVEGGSKRYRAIVRFESPIVQDDLERLESILRGAIIDQMTPTRVLRRRADRLRKKRVYSVTATLKGPHLVEFLIVADGGLYVKELIHGDGGRTKPSFAEILANKPLEIRLEFLGVSKRMPSREM